jgi:hypothetical protein
MPDVQEIETPVREDDRLPASLPLLQHHRQGVR